MSADSPPKTVGISLSGGGFRASFYALGALRYLAEVGVLDRVRIISAVSGGSIAAGVVADRWDAFVQADRTLDAFLEKIDKPFRDVVTTLNLRNIWLWAAFAYFFPSLFSHQTSRGAALSWTFDRHLYKHRDLADLPDGPQVIFTSTDLGIGRAFRMARDFSGSYDHGYAQPTPAGVGIGLAVAASAAFPMSFTVVRAESRALGLPTSAPLLLSLVDGGVYDNLGLEWFQGWPAGRPISAERPDFVIAVNASGPLEKTTQKYGALRALFRDLGVQYQQTLNVRVRWMVDRLLAGSDRGVYVGIALDPRRYRDPENKPIDPEFYSGALPSSFIEPLAFIRTDLDCFGEEEAELLSYHGYWSLHARLRTIVPELSIASPSWTKYAHISPSEESRLLRLLDDGKARKLWRRPKKAISPPESLHGLR